MGGYAIGFMLGLFTFVGGQSNTLQSCTFEPGQSCSLTQRGSQFQVTNAKKLWATDTKGPKYDVTLGNRKGYFAYVPNPTGAATYYTALPTQQGSVCMSFWHLGKCPGFETKVYMVSGNKRVGLFEVEEQEMGLWRLQQKTLTLSTSERYTLEIVVTYGSTAPPMCSVAIDNYKLTQGACTEMTDIPVRLAGGSTADEGRVEVQWNGQWGAVCKNGFGWAEAVTVCRALGKTGGRTKNLGDYGTASRMWLDGLKCPSFGAGSLGDCHHQGWGQVSCRPENYAKVRCNVQELPSASNRIRLADFKATPGGGFEGRLEVHQWGEWSSVCSTQFDDTAAKAACRMFGFNGDSRVKLAVTGQSPAVLKSVKCNQGELDFFNCKRSVLSAPCNSQAVVSCSYATRHFPYTCSYENGPQCSFAQLSNDDYDWTMGTDPSFRSLTKCTSQAPEEGTCSMLSETFDTPPFSGPKCLRFDYYVSSRNAGQLSVYLRLQNGDRKLIMWTAGQNGQRAQGSFSAQRDITESTFEVEFEATTDPKYLGYVGIRGFSVTAGLCSGDTLPSTPTPAPTPRPVTTTTGVPSTGSGKDILMCDFDLSDCTDLSDKPGEDFDWTRRSGATPSSGTGPQNDKKGKGFYMYIEASSPRRSGEKAVLQSGDYTATAYKRCLRLWYHMAGKNIGSLNIYWAGDNIGSLSGEKGKDWKEGEFNIPAGAGGKLEIEGVIGSDYRGDIAIDQVQFVDAPCSQTDPCASSPCANGQICQSTGSTYKCVTTTPAPNPNEVRCNFDKDMCDFTEVTLSQNPTQDGKGNWQWRNERTPSSQTGPTSGHATPPGLKGGYIYFEASGRTPKSVHTIESKSYPSSDNMCLKFYYHMWGGDMGKLIVKTKTTGASFTELQSIPETNFGYQEGYGNVTKHNKWLLFEKNVSGLGASSVTLAFDVICGKGYRSDVAIDDLSLVPRQC